MSGLEALDCQFMTNNHFNRLKEHFNRSLQQIVHQSSVIYIFIFFNKKITGP